MPVDSHGKLIGAGDIEAQTHAAFQQLQRAVEEAGFRMGDLVRLNTYYVYEGVEEDATVYWEKMTRVRLQYFPDPGPAATAVRVKGMGISGAMIQFEAEAVSTPLEARKRIMPAKSWDWSIPVPLSQGWKVGNQVWSGGQVSADEAGRATALGDVKLQTRNVLEHVRNVLKDAGGDFSHVTQIKICYLHDGDDAASEQRLSEMVTEVSAACGGTLPPMTAFGVNLLYEGLVLEIDCTAEISDRPQLRFSGLGANNLNRSSGTQALRIGQQLQIGGVSPQPQSFASDCVTALARISAQLSESGTDLSALSHLHVFVSGEEVNESPDRALARFTSALEQLCTSSIPPFTFVRVNGLPSNASIEVDAIAVLPE